MFQRHNAISKFVSIILSLCLVFSINASFTQLAYAGELDDWVYEHYFEPVFDTWRDVMALIQGGGSYLSGEAAYAYANIYRENEGHFPMYLDNGVVLADASALREYCNASFALWFIYHEKGWDDPSSAEIYEDAFKWLNQIAADGGSGPAAAFFGGMSWIAHQSARYTNSYEDVYGRAIYTLEETIGCSCPEMLGYATIVPDDSYQNTDNYKAYLYSLYLQGYTQKYGPDALGALNYNTSTDPLRLVDPTWKTSDFTSLIQATTWGAGKVGAKHVNTRVKLAENFEDGFTGDEAYSSSKDLTGLTISMLSNEDLLILGTKENARIVNNAGRVFYYGNLVADSIELYRGKSETEQANEYWANGEQPLSDEVFKSRWQQ